MDISYKNAKEYKSKITDIEKLLTESDDLFTDYNVRSLATNLRNQAVKDKVDVLPVNVILLLLETHSKEVKVENQPFNQRALSVISKIMPNNYSANNISLAKQDLSDKLVLNTFPKMIGAEISEQKLKLLTVLFVSDAIKVKKINIEKEYMPMIVELKNSLDYIIQHDKNAFMKFFQRGSIKKKLNDSRENFMANFYKIETLERELQLLDKISVSEIEVRNDFNLNPSKYMERILAVIEYDTKEGDLLNKLIAEKVAELEYRMMEFDEEVIEKRIRESWNKTKEIQIPHKLDSMMVEVLQANSEKVLPINELDRIGITTIGGLKKESDKLKQLKDNVSEEDYDDLINQLNIFVKTMEKDFYPQLRSNNLSEEEIELLGHLHHRQQLGKFERDIVNKAKNPLTQVKSILEILAEKDANDYKRQFYNDDIKHTITQYKENLFNSLEQFIEQFSEVQNIPLVQLTTNEIRKDFEKNSANYFAMLDRVMGGSKTYSPNDLPSFIVEKVNQYPLNTDSLKVTLRPYQEFGTKYALQYKSTLLGDEMGLGKTIQGIAMINHLYLDNNKHSIVVSPLSVLANWKREIEKWSDLPTYIYRGDLRRISLNKWQEQGGILLTNFEQTHHLVNDDKLKQLDLIIVDEAHYIKNEATKRAKNVNALAKKSKYHLYMTGTPIENRLEEMKKLISYLKPKLVRRIDRDFADYDPEKFKQLVSYVYLRRKRDEVLKELPEIEMVELWSNFSEIEQQYYNHAVSLGLSGLMKMRRAGFAGDEPKHSEKIKQLMDICLEAKENGDKVLIFSYFKIVLNKLQNLLGEDVVGMISGDVSTNQRQEMIDAFTEAEDGKILLSQIEAGGVGLNIQAANIVILCEPQWKPSTENQAISRVYRMGQTKNVIVYRLLTEASIDETMLEILGEKSDIFNQYAHDSLVSDAFDRRQAQDATVVSEDSLKKKVFEIERQRVEQLA